MWNFFYPNTLNSKSRIYFWAIRDFLIMCTLAIAGVCIYLSYKNAIVAGATLAFAICTMRIDADSLTVMDYLRILINYVFSSQIMVYDDNPIQLQNQSKAAKNTKRVQKKKPVAKKQRKQKKAKKVKTSSVSADGTKGKVFAVLMTIVLAVVGFGYGAIKVMEIQKENAEANATAATSEVVLTLNNEDLKFEYGDTDIDALSLVQSSSGTVTADPATIKLNSTGENEIVYTVTNEDGATNTFTKLYSVVDTTLPEISFEAENIDLKVTQEFDSHSNIRSVTDKGYGEIIFADALDYGTYIIKSNVDTTVAGSYTVTVTALDMAGNRAESSYTVTITE